MSIATELTALSGHITNAYDAVSTKGGTIPANKNMANLDDAILSIPSGGQITNGIIEQYKALSTTVPADTFFEFAKGTVADGATAGPTTAGAAGTGGSQEKVIKLDSTRLCAIYMNGANLHIVVQSVGSDGTVTYGSPSLIDTTASNALSQITLVGTDTVVVVYNTVASTSYGYTKAVVCSVSGMSVVVGTPVQITSSNLAYGNVAPGVVATSSNSALIVYEDAVSSTSGLYGRVYSISGLALTAAGDPGLIATGSFGNRRLTVDLGNGKFFVSTAATKACIVTVSGTAVSAGDAATVVSGPYGATIYEAMALSSTSVFLAFNYFSADYSYVYGVVLSISGDTITAGTQNSIGGRDATYRGIALIGEDKILCVYDALNSDHYAKICTVNGTSFSSTRTTLAALAQNGTSPIMGGLIALSDSLVIGTATVTGTTNAMSYAIVGPLVIQASQTKIDGLTAEDITTSTAGDVWVLNTGS